MQKVESHSFALVGAAIHWCTVKLPGHEEMLLECLDARLGHQMNQKHSLTGAEVEHSAGCYMQALQVGVCCLGRDPFPSAFAGATLHLEAKTAHAACVKLEMPAMLSKPATQVSQSALGCVLAVAATAQRLSEVVPGCVAARSLQPCVGNAVL